MFYPTPAQLLDAACPSCLPPAKRPLCAQNKQPSKSLLWHCQSPPRPSPQMLSIPVPVSPLLGRCCLTPRGATVGAAFGGNEELKALSLQRPLCWDGGTLQCMGTALGTEIPADRDAGARIQLVVRWGPLCAFLAAPALTSELCAFCQARYKSS